MNAKLKLHDKKSNGGNKDEETFKSCFKKRKQTKKEAVMLKFF